MNELKGLRDEAIIKIPMKQQAPSFPKSFNRESTNTHGCPIRAFGHDEPLILVFQLMPLP